MDGLISIRNQGDDLLVDSRDLAKLFAVKHAHLREQIESHVEILEQLGHIRFETEYGDRPQGGGRAFRYYWLNFDQTAFLLTLTRNTAQTKEFRFRLIVAFRNARERLRPVDKILLAVPASWKKTFEDSFYIELLRLYGDTFDASENKPSWVGGWTNKFIYEPIFQGLSEELKTRRKGYCKASGKDSEYIKLHQFLEEHAKKALSEHVTKITTLLTISRSKQDFLEYFGTMFHGHQQLHLFLGQLQDDFG